MRLARCALMIAAALMAACGHDDADGNGGNPVGPSGVSNTNETGSIAFSTTSNRGWNWIDIYVDGTYYGTIRRYYPSGGELSSCVPEDEARIVATVAAGNHTYSAQTNTGGSWTGTQSVGAGGCIEINLSCPNGDCVKS